jgi:uracil-DNA glycosylase
MPTRAEIDRCAHFLDEEVACLPHLRVAVALGSIAWNAWLDHALRRGVALPRPRPRFSHGARTEVPLAPKAAQPITLLGSYHVSQQNTQTGRLTPSMFDRILADAKRLAVRLETA